jgi:hypothetical protein
MNTAHALPICRSKHVLKPGEDVKLENAIFFHGLAHFSVHFREKIP